MKLILGLGNPGSKYQNTRHNAGFIVVSDLSQKHGIAGKSESKFNAIVGKGKIGNKDVVVAQPLTYMNLSGQAMSALMNFYKIKQEDILVIYDDLALDLGIIRFRGSGSDGGHNGIKSIVEHLGGKKNFDRLKVGIGPQPHMMPSEAYVLQKFSKDEEKLMTKVSQTCVEAIEFYIENDITNCMNKYNGIKINE